MNDPHTQFFDAWWQDFKARMDMANRLRLNALESPDADEAEAFHAVANQIVQGLKEEARSE